MVSNSSYSDFDNTLIGIFLLIVGLGPGLHYFMPTEVFGFSLLTTLIPFCLLTFLYLKNINKFNDKLFLLFILGILILVLFVRTLIYQENYLTLISSSAYIFYIPFLFSLFKKFEFTIVRRKSFLFIVLVVFLIHSINSIFYLINLPFIENVDKLSDDYVPFSRFTGILGGSNVQANFLAILFCLLVYSDENMGFIKTTILGIISIVCITPTLSRGAVLIVLLNMFYLIIRIFRRQTILAKCVLTFLLILNISLIDNVQFESFYGSIEIFQERFEAEDISGGRLDRLTFAYDKIRENFSAIVFGIPKVGQTKSDELNISDNSGTLVLANTGFIFSILFFYYIFFNFNFKYISASHGWVYVVSLALTVFVNNAFLHFQWCVFAIFGYYLIIWSKSKVFVNVMN